MQIAIIFRWFMDRKKLFSIALKIMQIAICVGDGESGNFETQNQHESIKKKIYIAYQLKTFRS